MSAPHAHPAVAVAFCPLFNTIFPEDQRGGVHQSTLIIASFAKVLQSKLNQYPITYDVSLHCALMRCRGPPLGSGLKDLASVIDTQSSVNWQCNQKSKLWLGCQDEILMNRNRVISLSTLWLVTISIKASWCPRLKLIALHFSSEILRPATSFLRSLQSFSPRPHFRINIHPSFSRENSVESQVRNYGQMRNLQWIRVCVWNMFELLRSRMQWLWNDRSGSNCMYSLFRKRNCLSIPHFLAHSTPITEICEQYRRDTGSI